MLKTTLKARALKETFSKLVSQLSATSVQGYRQVAVNCPNPVKVVIDKELPLTNSKSNFEEVISQAGEPAYYDSTKKSKGDNIEEFNTPIPSENTPVITEFTYTCRTILA